MKKGWLFAAGCALLAGCGPASDGNKVEGVVTDATMNTVTVVAASGDTLTFSTLNADRSELDGLLIGDTLEVSYAGKYAPGVEALKVAPADK